MNYIIYYFVFNLVFAVIECVMGIYKNRRPKVILISMALTLILCPFIMANYLTDFYIRMVVRQELNAMLQTMRKI